MRPDQSPNNEPDSSPSGSAADLPHDRDEQSKPVKENGQHRDNRKPIAQARKDVEAGIKDTERIGVPNDVPSSANNGGKR